MKIVFQKVEQWERVPNAESELAQRFLLAAQSLGLDCLATSNIKQIEAFNPDIVVPLHFYIPKLFDAFTIGCMWNPEYAINHNNAWENFKTYDGYGVASPGQEQLVRALKFKSPSEYLTTYLYPSANTTVYKEVEQFRKPAYIGSNWSKDRHHDFFISSKNIEIFGPLKSWAHLVTGQYMGELPFDGKSYLKVYRDSGIGLALHHPDHNNEGLPSMRPFEISASGAVMIADKNPFIIENFGDNVFYLDTDSETKDLIEQFESCIEAIKSHPAKAKEMAYACHEIFVKKFSLEICLENLISDVHEFKYSRKKRLQHFPGVDIVVRTDGEDLEKLYRALKSIREQTYKLVTVLIVFRGSSEKKSQLKEKISADFSDIKVDIVYYPEKPDRASQFFTGLRAGHSEYVGFLDHDDILFSDHIETLVGCLEDNRDVILAYSGSLRIWEGGVPPDNSSIRELAFFHDQNDRQNLIRCITSNSYLARRDKIPWSLMNQPIPYMDKREDFVFLKLLYEKSFFLFSEKVTNAFYWRVSKNDNSAFDECASNTSREILLNIMRKSTKLITYGNSTIEKVSISRNMLRFLQAKIFFIIKQVRTHFRL